MNFTPSEEQSAAMDSLRRYLDNVMEPELKSHGEGFIVREKMQRWMQGLSDFGLINAPHPVEWGGLGLDWQTHLLLVEEVAVTSIDLCLSLALNSLCADSLINAAPRHLQEKYLPGLLKGELFGSAGISEPDIGSNVAGVKTRAVRDGDDWIINGEKTWITNGEYSDFLICTCKTGENELTHILIDRHEHGYGVQGIPKMALNGQSTAQIFLSDVRVPVSNTLGELGSGLKNTFVLFERARCHMAAWGYGLARRAMEEAIRYSQERVQWGKPIAGHQLIAAKLATMATEIDAARLLTLRAITLIDEGKRCDKECAMAKWYATELAVRVTRDAVQIHGGNGVTRAFIVERLAREAIIAPIPDGTTEIQKLLISRSLTGIQAFV